VADERAPAPSQTDEAGHRLAQQRANLRGILLVVAAMGAFSLNDTLTKTTSAELPTGEILAIRGFFACLLLAPLVAMTAGFGSVARAYSPPIMIRNVSEVVAVILFLSALFRLPLANVTAILQTLPLTMTAAAALLLKEQVGWRRWTAATVGLLGILLVIRPGTDAFSWWYVAAIICVLFITARDIATRFIDSSTPSITITFITALVVMLAGLALGTTEDWIIPSAAAVIRLAFAAVLVIVGYYTLIECWRGTEISVVAPFRYTVVIWAMAFGYLFLGEIPSWWTVGGAVIVVLAGVYTLHRERIVAKQQ
jgi:drug/metabolite transporter (DMT)-like permease